MEQKFLVRKFPKMSVVVIFSGNSEARFIRHWKLPEIQTGILASKGKYPTLPSSA